MVGPAVDRAHAIAAHRIISGLGLWVHVVVPTRFRALIVCVQPPVDGVVVICSFRLGLGGCSLGLAPKIVLACEISAAKISSVFGWIPLLLRQTRARNFRCVCFCSQTVLRVLAKRRRAAQ